MWRGAGMDASRFSSAVGGGDGGMVVRAVCSVGSNTVTAVWIGRSWAVGA